MKKIAVITGASKGIGLSCAKAFLKKGFIVVDASRTEAGKIKNKNYMYVKTDISKEKDVKVLIEKVIDRFGRIDVLICNAGFGKFANLVDSKTKDFDSMFAVNVKGVYLSCRYALPHMLEQKSGTIIIVSSIAGKNGVASASIYSATKHAVIGLASSLMAEVRKDNVRVVTVCPGSVDTNFFDQPGTILNSRRETILSPDDVAAACLLAVELPQNALMNEIEIRPLMPSK
ncbi:MAG: SDR family oxidoreductase [Ignavibacteria bacterium]|nr:SDR family oxidoreductase [Ignavibacteria bacterium]